MQSDKISQNVHFRRFGLWLLFLFVILGLLCGIYIASHASEELVLWMRTVPSHSASIVGLLAVCILPLILSYLVVHSGRIWLFLFLLLLKSLSWSCCSFLILSAFSSAGWLMHALFLFSDNCSLLLLSWCAIHHLSGVRCCSQRSWGLFLVLSVAVACVDYCVISPFTTQLLSINR